MEHILREVLQPRLPLRNMLCLLVKHVLKNIIKLLILALPPRLPHEESVWVDHAHRLGLVHSESVVDRRLQGKK